MERNQTNYRLISLNIWSGVLIKKLIPFLRKKSNKIDIFAFQEVTDWPKPMPIGPEHIIASDRVFFKIKAALPNFIPYKSEYYSNEKLFLAIFVRKGINVKEARTFKLVGPIKVFGFDAISKLFCINIEENKKSLWICDTHGILVNNKWRDDTPSRIKQSKKILDILSKLDGEKILCGDFNLNRNTKSIRMIESKLKSMIKEYRIKNTRNKYFNARKNDAVDHMFVSEGIKVKKFKVMKEVVSDHQPIYLEFSIN